VDRQEIKWENKKDNTVTHVSHCAEPADEILKFTQFSVDKASDEIFWMGSDGRILFVNDAACNVLGYTKAELWAMYVWNFDPDYSPELWRSAWLELKEHGSRIFETRHRASDGRVFPVEITANYPNYKGREYDFAFVMDITERKQAGAGLRASEARLDSISSGARPRASASWSTASSKRRTRSCAR
jgi:two-component system, NtrC family, sensor kinase